MSIFYPPSWGIFLCFERSSGVKNKTSDTSEVCFYKLSQVFFMLCIFFK